MDLSDFSVSTLIAGFVFSTFGFYMMRHGKKQGNFKAFGFGLALFVYPYFVANPYAAWGIGVGLTFTAFLMI